MFRMYELIKKKRDKKELTTEEIKWIINGYTKGDIPDYQVSALLMAIYFNGLNDRELFDWTEAMIKTGEVIDLSSIKLPKIDKHSTGGVGDKTSFILAPIAAACGIVVPMISGRGLGHTGGTLDKLESVPGIRTDISNKEFVSILQKHRICLIGQTKNLVPADKKLYALRDVTGTVESIQLICSSIMSKKISEGIDGLVLDVKVGQGAFMKTMKDARALAQALVNLGKKMNKKVVALITDMNQPLGQNVGNSLEMIECFDVLKGKVVNDLSYLSCELAAHMLLLGKVASTIQEARTKVANAIVSGDAIDKMKEMIEAQGGDPSVVDDYTKLPQAKHTKVFVAKQKGIIQNINAEEVGLAAMSLGAGREKVDSKIDHAVGFVLLKKVGDKVNKDDPLLVIHYNDGERIKEVLESVQFRLDRAFKIDKKPVKPPKLIKEIIR
jgi:pyrimidine-nucleoside phosphorylase